MDQLPEEGFYVLKDNATGFTAHTLGACPSLGFGPDQIISSSLCALCCVLSLTHCPQQLAFCTKVPTTVPLLKYQQQLRCPAMALRLLCQRGPAAASRLRRHQPACYVNPQTTVAALQRAVPAAASTSGREESVSTSTELPKQQMVWPKLQSKYCRMCGSEMAIIQPEGDKEWRHVCKSCQYIGTTGASLSSMHISADLTAALLVSRPCRLLQPQNGPYGKQTAGGVCSLEPATLLFLFQHRCTHTQQQGARVLTVTS